jgi:hypothetical protein
LCLKQMQMDNDQFPVSAIDLQGAKVLVRPEQAESTKVKNVIIGEERPKSSEDKIWSREVVLEKDADGKDVLKILWTRGASQQLEARLELYSAEHTEPTSQTNRANRSDRSNYDESAKDARAEES